MGWVFNTNAVSITSLVTIGSGWHAVDLSTKVPAGTKAVAIEIVPAGGQDIGFRPSGVSSTRTGWYENHLTLIVPLDANLKFDAHVGGTGTTLFLRAYTNTGTWQTSGAGYVDKSTGTIGSFVDVDASALMSVGDNFAFMDWSNASGSNSYNTYLRVNSNDTANAYGVIHISNLISAFSGLDINRKFQQQIANTYMDLWFSGSDKIVAVAAKTWHTCATGTWADLNLIAELPAGCLGIFYEIYFSNNPSGAYLGARCKGSTDTFQLGADAYGHAYGCCAVDADRKIQVSATGTGIPVIAVVGYVMPPEQNISGVGGIASEEAFGTPTVEVAVLTQDVGPAGGIASEEAFGTPVITVDPFLYPSGIPSEEAFGTPSLLVGPLPCRSLTICQDIPTALDNCRSLTICMAIQAARPADCRSLTTCDALGLNRPAAGRSLTFSQDIPLRNGGLFLVF